MDGIAVSPFRFVWWNVQSFGHYEDAWVTDPRLPRSPAEYAAKRERVAAVLRQLNAQEQLDLIALAEITSEAALDLRQTVCPDFEVFAIDSYFDGRPTFQVALLYNPRAGRCNEDLFIPVDVSEASRAMAILDFAGPDDVLRTYACHFTSQMGGEISARNRSEMARQLNRQVYDFLRGSVGQRARHVLILGDLNEEPFGMIEEDLFARRDRRWVRTPHGADIPLRRARLYNCGWRLLGERVPHPSPLRHGDAAGTYYSRERNRWYTWDHVLVSGSLLTEDLPYLDEKSIQVVSGPGLVGPDGRPSQFRLTDGQVEGVSDHLPVRGQILFP